MFREFNAAIRKQNKSTSCNHLGRDFACLICMLGCMNDKTLGFISMIAKISLLGRDVYDLTDLIFNPSSYCQKIEEVKREPDRGCCY